MACHEKHDVIMSAESFVVMLTVVFTLYILPPMKTPLTAGISFKMMVCCRMYCFYNNMQYAAVDIYPVLTDRNNFNVLLTRPSNNSYFFEDGLGGEVVTSLTISFQNAPYIVNRSIFVA